MKQCYPKNETIVDKKRQVNPIRSRRDERPLQLGKSPINALLKQERIIGGTTLGLTRDGIVIEWAWEDGPVQTMDMAGIPRKLTPWLDDIEDMAVSDTLRAIKRPMWQCWYWMHTRNTCNNNDKNILFAITRTCYCECGRWRRASLLIGGIGQQDGSTRFGWRRVYATRFCKCGFRTIGNIDSPERWLWTYWWHRYSKEANDPTAKSVGKLKKT